MCRAIACLHILLTISQVVPVHAALPDAFLKAYNQTLCDHAGSGEVARLRGVNLGNWFYLESWMTPSQKTDPATSRPPSGATRPRSVICSPTSMSP
jgi:hypothetical protein